MAVAFAAWTGATDGAIAKIAAKAESARIVRTSPELNFLEYAFIGVYIFSGRGEDKGYLDPMDNLSISCRLALNAPENGSPGGHRRSSISHFGRKLVLIQFRDPEESF